MKILYVLPNNTTKSGGNWATVSRLSEGLKKRGISVDIVEAQNVTDKILMKYDAVHAFHVFKTFLKIQPLLKDFNKTVVVSFTGTDLAQLQELGESRDSVVDLLNNTDGIVVFHNEARNDLVKERILEDKIKIIPQASMPISYEVKRKKHIVGNSFSSETVVFLFAAGIRRVKAPLELIDMMSLIAEQLKNIRLVFIGPILEKDVGEKFKEKIKDKNWAIYLGKVSHQETQEFIAESDIVINTSFSEGMPNTLLEAQQMGKPVLARDIAGNRVIVTHGVDGFLFKNSEEFEYYATQLVRNPELRKDMGLAGIKARENYTWTEEVSEYEILYRLKEKN